MKSFYTVLLSHGNFAKEALKSAEMIAGDMPDFAAVGLFPGMGREELEAAVNAVLSSEAARQKEKVLLLCDVPYGTPSNVALLMAAQNKNITVISGLSLPLVLNAYDWDSMDEEEAKRLVEESRGLTRVVSVTTPKPGCAEEEDL